jgi:hypothetical protein
MFPSPQASSSSRPSASAIQNSVASLLRLIGPGGSVTDNIGSEKRPPKYTETGSRKSRTMNEIVVLALFTVPLLSFVSAGMLEFQRDRQSLRSLTRMLPLAFATVLSILLLIPIDLYFQYVSSSRLSILMSVLSLLVAVSALVCPYKSRSTAALIFIGGLVLAFFWLLNRVVA